MARLAKRFAAPSLQHSASLQHWFHASDAGGNVTALLDSGNCLAARYHYDPFGNLLGLAGPMADANLYRFSSKDFHPNSSLYYYGFLFYDPNPQRWMNRDPMGEAGGVNLYRFVRNRALNSKDAFGLFDLCFGIEGEVALFDVGWDFSVCLVIDTDHWRQSGICVGGGPAFGLTGGVGCGAGLAFRDTEGESVNIDLNFPGISPTASFDADGWNGGFISLSLPGLLSAPGAALSHTRAETLAVGDVLEWLRNALDGLGGEMTDQWRWFHP